MLGGNNEVEAVSTKEIYSQDYAHVGGAERGAERGADDGRDTARNWLDGIYGANSTEIKYPVFMGTTYSMNYINHNDAFLVAKEISEIGNPYNLPTTADSHLMKDSEWGAVAYLGQSRYGLGEKEVCINNVTLNSGNKVRQEEGKTGVESVYTVTGLTSKAVIEGQSEVENNVGENAQQVVNQIKEIKGNTPTEIGEIYTWNQKSGQEASSSETIYGIYDLSGGLTERTAAYTANGNGALTSFGKSLLYKESPTEEKSTKYVTVYAHNPEYDKNEGNLNMASSENYKLEANKRKFGNAMQETSTAGTGSTLWRGDYSYFVGLDNSFFVRGGIWIESTYAGLFCFGRSRGDSTYSGRISCGLSWYVVL